MELSAIWHLDDWFDFWQDINFCQFSAVWAVPQVWFPSWLLSKHPLQTVDSVCQYNWRSMLQIMAKRFDQSCCLSAQQTPYCLILHLWLHILLYTASSSFHQLIVVCVWDNTARSVWPILFHECGFFSSDVSRGAGHAVEFSPNLAWLSELHWRIFVASYRLYTSHVYREKWYIIERNI